MPKLKIKVVILLTCTTLLILAGCGKSNNQDNKDNMGNMDHSKMKMENAKK